MPQLSHLNADGRPRMVQVGNKDATLRVATAGARVQVHPDTLIAIREGQLSKGDVLSTAQLAGIMAAKNTSGLIPMCHPLLLTGVDMDFQMDEYNHHIDIFATVSTSGQTGVEMEALTAVTVAALTIYDMCKAIQRDIQLGPIRLISKSGGKSGNFHIPWYPQEGATGR